LIPTFLSSIISILLSIAFLTLVERKTMASIQIRRGPNVTGYGLLQPLADGLKLFLKELIIPARGNIFLFLASPLFFLALSLSVWSILPIGDQYITNNNINILIFLAISSLASYGFLIGGWASNSRYSFLGCIRGASQLLSYELVLGLLILTVVICAQTFNILDFVSCQSNIWFIFPLLPLFLFFMIAVLAESNRPPFDLPEAESELVSGYNTEYSSSPFAFYFIGEYGTLITWSHVMTFLFLGGTLPIYPFLFLPGIVNVMLKVSFLLFLFCWIRASVPRYRWDQLMYLCWRILLPISLSSFFFLFTFLFVLT
jgi:NADH-quinone oxidoreductase subunit H